MKNYAGFGPTLLAEHLGGRKLEVEHEALQPWLLAQSKWRVRWRRKTHRQWRERKAYFGRWCSWPDRATTGSRDGGPHCGDGCGDRYRAHHCLSRRANRPRCASHTMTA